MQKLFTLVCAAIFSLGLMADDATLVLNNGATSTPESYFTVSGKYSSNYTGVYAGIEFTKGLKMESSTSVTFTITSVSNVILVQSTSNNSDKTIKFDGNALDINSGKTDVAGTTTCRVYTLEGVAAGNHTISRGSGESGLLYVAVADARKIVSTTETLKAVAINNVAISETNFNKLVAQGEIILEDSYVTAPVVKFTKHVVVKYDDDTTTESDEDIEKTSTVASAGTWGASASIGGETYAVYTVKALSYTVTYKFGEKKLGEEVVAANGHPAEYETYQTLPLATFGGWFNNADLAEAHAVADIAAEVISADKTYFAKFTLKYTKSINIEQLVLDNSTQYSITAAFDEANIEYANLNSLDSLNDQKTKRNEPFLGLKLKAKDAKIACRIKAGDTITVKLGNVGDDIKLGVNGQYETLPKAKAEYVGRRATKDEYLELITTSNSTVVIKQIMINKDIEEVELPAQVAFIVDCKTPQNGKLSASWEGKGSSDIAALPGKLITLTVTPDEGYEIEDVKVDGVSLNENEGKYTFNMPAKNVEVTATFEAEATALDNTNATVKATKVVRNGQLLIEKNGEVYNVLGTRVR